MPEPCRQEGNVAALLANRANLERTLERIEAGQAEFIAVLRDISAQGEQIKSLVHRMDKSEQDTEGLYKRMRDVELAPAKQASATQTGIIVAIVSAIVSGIVALLSKKIGS